MRPVGQSRAPERAGLRPCRRPNPMPASGIVSNPLFAGRRHELVGAMAEASDACPIAGNQEMVGNQRAAAWPDSSGQSEQDKQRNVVAPRARRNRIEFPIGREIPGTDQSAGVASRRPKVRSPSPRGQGLDDGIEVRGSETASHKRAPCRISVSRAAHISHLSKRSPMAWRAAPADRGSSSVCILTVSPSHGKWMRPDQSSSGSDGGNDGDRGRHAL
jgi:hypothetical protein